MAMVCDYYSDEHVDPHVLNMYIKATNKGLLSRPSVAKHYGFTEFAVSSNINIEKMMSELYNGRLIIAHIRPGAKGTGKDGHFVVLNGYLLNESQSIFYVGEPASRLSDTVSMTEAVEIFDKWWSYGKEGGIHINKYQTN